MNPPSIPFRDRVLGGLFGCAIGDALGVPVEFGNRAAVQSNPVTGLRGYGMHGQPPGTWSDDTSLMLCVADSLRHHAFDTTDMAQRFLDWYERSLWTAHGVIFDIGIATERALSAFGSGTSAEMAGGRGEFSNGNGSLMRQLPVALRFAGEPVEEMMDKLHRVSSITHGHLRSLMACGFHGLVVRELLRGLSAADALDTARQQFKAYYSSPVGQKEWPEFRLLFSEKFTRLGEDEINSDGYVMDTLIASLWCLVTTQTFEQCVLKAVNLGGDTDTTGCVAGGLAGVYYGLSAIPADWRNGIARSDDLAELFDSFVSTIPSTSHSTLNSEPRTRNP